MSTPALEYDEWWSHVSDAWIAPDDTDQTNEQNEEQQ